MNRWPQVGVLAPSLVGEVQGLNKSGTHGLPSPSYRHLDGIQVAMYRVQLADGEKGKRISGS
jgi:hypothetical protein